LGARRHAVDDPDLIDWAIDFVEDVGRC
jgi:hypothetical protein